MTIIFRHMTVPYFAKLTVPFMLSVLILSLATNGPIRASELEYHRLGLEVRRLVDRTRYVQAEKVAETYIGKAIRDRGKNSILYANAISLKAYVLQNQSERAEAKKLFQQALDIYRNLSAPTEYLAKGINNMGQTLQAEGNFKGAEKYYNEALGLQQRDLSKEHADIATSLTNLAYINQARGQFNEAEAFLKRALHIRKKIFPANHPIIASTVQNLATAAEAQHQLKRAEKLLHEALAMRQKSQPDTHPQLGGAYHRLGVNLYRQRRYPDAVKMMKKAINIRRKRSAFQPDLARNLTDIAQIYLLYKRYDTAEKYLQEASRLYAKFLPRGHKYIAEVNRDLAYVYEGRGRVDKALGFSRQASAIYIDRHARDLSARVQYQNHILLLWKQWRLSKGKQKPKLMKEAFALAQSAGITDTVATVNKMAVRLATDNQQLQKAIRLRQDLARQRKSLEYKLTKRLAAGRPRKETLNIRRKVELISRQISKIDDRIGREFPDYQRLVRPQPVTIKNIRRTLRADEALVLFSTAHETLFVWAISRNQVRWSRLKPSLKDVQSAVQKLRAQLDIQQLQATNSKVKLFNLKEAHTLYRHLFGSVETTLKGKKQLIIVSSDILTSLPYQVLVTSPPKKSGRSMKLGKYASANWFARKWAFSVLPAANHLRALRLKGSKRQASRELIGFGDPDFAGMDGSGEAKVAAQRQTVRAVSGKSDRLLPFRHFWRSGRPDLKRLRLLVTPAWHQT